MVRTDGQARVLASPAAGMAYLVFRCGEVAEPGLRRTPGTRVEPQGSRGFESPPLRQPVPVFLDSPPKGPKSSHLCGLFLPQGTRRSVLALTIASKFGD